MINTYMCTGRLVSDPEIRELESGKKVCNVTLAVPRSYKNADGEYDTDFLDCTIWGGIAEKTTEYCKKGDLIGIRGRLESNFYDTDKGEKVKRTVIVAEKISFLASTKEKEIEPDLEG